tara:strand:- start:47 stop:193 length:147 start_codon:yes stop_codon:yes gene_type:complete
MRYAVKVKRKQVYKTDELKNALKVVAQLFRKGQDDVYLYGGKLGKWRD